MFNYIKIITFLTLLGLMSGCNGQEMNQEMNNGITADEADFDELVAVLHPTEGNDTNGVIRFFKTDAGVRVVAEVHGLEANSTHGFHVHEFGDCTSPDATSSGGHFDPLDMPHAGPAADERHVGDMGNLHSDDDGIAELDYIDHKMAFSGERSILGRAVIVHAEEDDLETQPTGDAGARLSCGVIGVAQQE